MDYADESKCSSVFERFMGITGQPSTSTPSIPFVDAVEILFYVADVLHTECLEANRAIFSETIRCRENSFRGEHFTVVVKYYRDVK